VQERQVGGTSGVPVAQPAIATAQKKYVSGCRIDIRRGYHLDETERSSVSENAILPRWFYLPA
jgi:hypothetical protein